MTGRPGRAVTVLERLSFMLSGAQLGITVTGLVVGFLAEPSVSALLRPALDGAGLPDGAVSAISVTLSFVVATVIQMVLGELAPKNLALAVPERMAKSLAASTPRLPGGSSARSSTSSTAWRTGCCAGSASNRSRNSTTAPPWRSSAI
ncbi:hypothetical protein SMICM17S_00271 [Streptomyces microflavus]